MSSSLARQASGSAGPPAASSSASSSTNAPRSTAGAAAVRASDLLAAPSAGSSRSRHSLYGVEDRVVLDLGSRIFKVGFSGESAPRAVFDVGDGELWSAECHSNTEIKRLQRKVKRWIRRVYYDELMTDPKARKVILLENPMLPVHVKEIIANTCLELLGVPSLSFACAPLCSLLSLGRITGLVLDVGNLEACLLPIYSSRPLFSHVRTTPIASKHLSRHLRALLSRFALYLPSSSTSTSVQRQPFSPVPETVLTPFVVEEIKTRACFIEPDTPDDDLSWQHAMEHCINSEHFEDTGSEAAAESDIAWQNYLHSKLKQRYRAGLDELQQEEASDLTMRLAGGTLTVPGWLRHACTDVFFDSSGDIDTPSIPEIILDTLLKLPIDLRKVMISTILITGGGSMIPGFPLRLENCLHTLLHREKRYIPLRGLSRNIHIINSGTHKTTVSQQLSNPVPSQSSDMTSEEGSGQAGTDFCWERSLLPWVGASLIGALKSGGNEEWTKESLEAVQLAGQSIGDWSRQSLE